MAIINGTTGNDTLIGTADGDTLIGLAGNDSLCGGQSNDTYIFNKGEGQDTIYDYATSNSGTADTLVMQGISSNEVVFTFNNARDIRIGAVAVNVNNSTDKVILSSQNDVNARIENFVFSDTTLDFNQMIQRLVINGTSGNDNITASMLGGKTYGLAGNDTLVGGVGNDSLIGGIGNDSLAGGLGDDTYIFNIGDGQDTIYDYWYTGTPGTNDTFALPNVSVNDVTFSINMPDMQIGTITANINNTTDKVVLYSQSDIKARIEYFVFSDATLTYEQIVQRLVINGTPNADVITGTVSAERINGLAGNDIINAVEGNDTIAGNQDNDSLSGGMGSDVYIFNAGDGQDTINEMMSTTDVDILKLNDIPASNVNFTTNGTDIIIEVKNSTDKITILAQKTGFPAIESFVFSDVTLTAEEVIARIGINGTDGDDSLTGTASADTISAFAGNDTVNALDGNDLIYGGDGNDTINAGAGADILYGDNGDDTLEGGAGADTMIGGAGNDVYYIDNASDLITENANEGIDTVNIGSTYTLGGNIENLTLTGTANINGTGSEVDNYIVGNTGSNTINGGLGNDTMRGGLGDDTYYVDSVDDLVVENPNEGNDTVISSIEYSLVPNVENLVLTETTDLTGTGNELNNRITGNSGNNTIDGGLGADNMVGGLGNDTYLVDNTADLITENANEGIDTVNTSMNYTISANIENLNLTGTANINGVGNEADNYIVGNDGNNSITGNAGNDTLDGGAGTDTMIGGAGNDVYYVDSESDVITEGSGAGTDTVNTSNSYTLGGNIENLTLTGTANLSATGSEVDNYIVGNTGNNTIDGALGNDTMLGGLGNDTYYVDSTSDIIVENADEGTDTVNTSMNYTLSANIENLTLSGTTDLTGTGNEVNNRIAGNSGNNTLDGGLGADTLTGGLGNDTYYIDNAGDVVTENTNEGIDTVISNNTYIIGANIENFMLSGTANINGTGNAGNNNIAGNAGNNVLTGNGGHDTIDGGVGTDTMIGGAGNDVYYVDSTTDVVTESSGAGTDTVISNIAYTLGANIENLVLTGTTDLSGTGNTVANTVTGNSGNNTISGGTGVDTLIGGLGNDTYIVDNSSDVVIENADEGIDTVNSSVNYTIGANIENFVLTGTTSIRATGNDLANTITGNSGNNTLDGGLGADTMIGGLGTDLYVVDNLGDVITETSGQGTDAVNSSIDYTLGTNIERLTLTGTTAIYGTGNELNNTITGNAIDNIIDGSLGADTMIGGAGNDTYYVDNTRDIVRENSGQGTDTVYSSVSYTIALNAEKLVLTGTSDLSGTGNALTNTITGNSGNNSLDGGTGADTLIGGLGNDTYFIDTLKDVIIENANEGIDTVSSNINYTLASNSNIENLTLTGIRNVNGTGNEYNNVITGNALTNIIDGGLGADTMAGGAGHDTYYVDNAGDLIVETVGQGTDVVNSIINYTLGANTERLTLTGTTAIYGTGNELNNTITGNELDNILDGGLGNDNMVGGLGNDTYIADSATDIAVETAGQGTDTVNSSVNYTLGANVENLVLTGTTDLSGTGNTLANTITGNSGNNTISGGTGADTLVGGLGNDTYVVDNIGDVVVETAGQGTDTVNSSVNYTLGTNVENLLLSGTSGISGTGNELANTITGNSAGNVLNGGLGADTLVGCLGNDTYYIDSTGDLIVESANEGTDIVNSNIDYTLAANLERLALSGTAIYGTGNELNNTIAGNELDNILDGGLGADSMGGGLGNDIYNVDNTSDIVAEAVNAGTDTVNSSVNYTIGANVENLVLTGTADLIGTGNTLANTVTGNAGNNTISGGTGADTLIGGLGNDTYVVDNIGDVIIENAAQGTDLINSSVNYILGSNLENLVLTGTSSISATGNELANTITGNSGNNTISGGLGADTLIGGAGSDTYLLNTGDSLDFITDTAGTDAIVLGAQVDKTKIAFFKDSLGQFYVDYGNSAGADIVTVSNWNTSINQIERIRLNDGTFITNTDANTIIQNMTAYATANSISLTGINDVKNNADLMSLYMNTAWHS